MTLAPMNILVVDDMAKNLLAMQALLQRDEVRVLTAADGPAALELLLTHDIGLALLDVQMPGMDGYALAELMRGSARTRPVPIIFVTAFAPDEQRSFRGYESGAVDFLYKPVDPRVLRSKVQVFLELHQQRGQLAQRMAELERLGRLNALMIGALSHDIRTPLAALTLNAELVQRKAELPALQQAGARLKAATSMLSRQVDHLVNLATLPTLQMQPEPTPGDLAALVGERMAALLPPEGDASAPRLQVSGDGKASFDAGMLARAVDHLLLLAINHGGGQPLQVQVDGESRRAVVLRLRLLQPLGEQSQRHLFGAAMPGPGMPTSCVGPGLDDVEQVARAHGGSVIGRSNPREGTLLELMLPRDLP
ncbi:MAG: hybrid sensor histidine kinase/response regulator [Pseudomonadota bacterium]